MYTSVDKVMGNDLSLRAVTVPASLRIRESAPSQRKALFTKSSPRPRSHTEMLVAFASFFGDSPVMMKKGASLEVRQVPDHSFRTPGPTFGSDVDPIALSPSLALLSS
jgi:hypothetical protein